MDSSAWSQKGQACWWGKPRLASQSEVQHRLLMASQIKNLQLEGAQLFQTRFQGWNLMVPVNMEVYADLQLYTPEEDSFQ